MVISENVKKDLVEVFLNAPPLVVAVAGIRM